MALRNKMTASLSMFFAVGFSRQSTHLQILGNSSHQGRQEAWGLDGHRVPEILSQNHNGTAFRYQVRKKLGSWLFNKQCL